jgi:hypothetical protein
MREETGPTAMYLRLPEITTLRGGSRKVWAMSVQSHDGAEMAYRHRLWHAAQLVLAVV